LAQVVDPIIDDSSGSEAFEKATLEAMRNWQYEPATWQGDLKEQLPCFCRATIGKGRWRRHSV